MGARRAGLMPKCDKKTRMVLKQGRSEEPSEDLRTGRKQCLWALAIAGSRSFGGLRPLFWIWVCCESFQLLSNLITVPLLSFNCRVGSCESRLAGGLIHSDSLIANSALRKQASCCGDQLRRASCHELLVGKAKYVSSMQSREATSSKTLLFSRCTSSSASCNV